MIQGERVNCSQCMDDDECGQYHQDRGHFKCQPATLSDQELEVYAREYLAFISRFKQLHKHPEQTPGK